jgi:peroxin-2
MAIFPGTLRSSQIDAAELDQEFVKILKEQVFDLGFLGVNVNKFKPEVDLLFDFIVNYSILATGQSYGLSLENLVYKAKNHKPLSKMQKGLYTLSRVISVWGWTRFQMLINSFGWSDQPPKSWKFKLWKLLQKLELFAKGLSFVNFILFLRNGRFRSLTDRFLGMTLVYDQPKVHRMINFEFMNQQLVWEAFTEFFVTLLPIINVATWKRRAKAIFGKNSVT